ncbi:MAG: uroporphyrinogen decarboxylase family protein [Clostridia bacterium]
MDSRERVNAAMVFQKPDRVPLQYHPSPRGYYEYGEKMRELFRKYPYDFDEDVLDQPVPVPPAYAFNEKGEYHELKRDEWGVLWEYRIFGIQGHPLERPLDDFSALGNYRMPPNRTVEKKNTDKYLLKGWGSLLEKLIALRNYEDVLMDLQTDSPEINRLADMLVEHQLRDIDNLLAAGVDSVQFGDDFGTQYDLILSPAVFRRFFKPRFGTMIDKVKKAGKKVHFHSCGANDKILEDLKDLGIDSYWPQLTAYDTADLARRLKEYKIACALHFRGDIMNHGTPEDVTRWVNETSALFDVQNGSAWFYIEIDDGFPYENTVALFEAVDKNR